jgi:hypothetical protein
VSCKGFNKRFFQVLRRCFRILGSRVSIVEPQKNKQAHVLLINNICYYHSYGKPLIFETNHFRTDSTFFCRKMFDYHLQKVLQKKPEAKWHFFAQQNISSAQQAAELGEKLCPLLNWPRCVNWGEVVDKDVRMVAHPYNYGP